MVYPTAFRERIEAEGRRRELEPWLIASLARQESLFEPRAESPAGAVGLLQLLPRTARALALRAGLASVTVEDLRSPEVNLALGALHLQDLVRRFEGRTDEVLVAYNAGDGRLARWKRTPEARDPDLFLERIPYRETREYVRAVREGAGIYRALWTDG